MTSDDENSSKLRTLRNTPVCIICARPSEAEIIAKVLGISAQFSGHDVSLVKDAHTFYLGEFQTASKETLQYYITSSLRQGIQSFTINAAILFNILRPKFVIHAGVCAAFKGQGDTTNMNLRDVIFGEAAINYQEGKFETIGNGEVIFRPDYHRITVASGDMQAFVKTNGSHGYHYGEYISGSAVRSDAGPLFEKIRSQVNRNAIALDMEASAFFQLCDHFSHDGPRCLGVVKGISDFGDPEKGHDATVYNDALINTGKALKSWIWHRIRAITWPVDESGEPGANIVSGYYNNFVRRVVDNHVQGWPVRYKDDNVTVPHDEIQGFISILPKGNEPSFFKELGNIETTIRRYGIKEVVIGGRAGERYLYYKAGYLIDFCRCVNSLESYEDAEYQLGVFKRTLNDQPYYRQKLDDGHPHARVLSWEDALSVAVRQN